MRDEQTKGSENLPLLLTTAEAARYIAGISISDRRPVKTRRFLEFATQCGIVPKCESKTIVVRRNGEKHLHCKRQWSRVEIDEAVGLSRNF